MKKLNSAEFKLMMIMTKMIVPYFEVRNTINTAVERE